MISSVVGVCSLDDEANRFVPGSGRGDIGNVNHRHDFRHKKSIALSLFGFPIRHLCFTDAERAALALTEAVTRLSDREEPVSDAVWKEAAAHYDEKALASLLLVIANINVWNRLNVATRQVAGAWS